MDYLIRKATTVDILPALDLVFKVFMKFDAPFYGIEHTERMRESIEGRRKDVEALYFSDNRLMYVALDDEKVVGVIETYGTNRISLMFVDENYQRKGVATALMKEVVGELRKKGYREVLLNSSPTGIAFYCNFGFVVQEDEKNSETPWKTPMHYIIK